MKNRWSSQKIGKYIVKYSKSNKTWQIWDDLYLVTDFALKKNAVSYATREDLLTIA